MCFRFSSKNKTICLANLIFLRLHHWKFRLKTSFFPKSAKPYLASEEKSRNANCEFWTPSTKTRYCFLRPFFWYQETNELPSNLVAADRFQGAHLLRASCRNISIKSQNTRFLLSNEKQERKYGRAPTSISNCRYLPRRTSLVQRSPPSRSVAVAVAIAAFENVAHTLAHL